jgi:nucleoside-diphosphate-sugar epimerase
MVRRTSRLTWLPADRVELVYGEVTDSEALSDAARGIDVIYHVAGITRAETHAEYDRVNADGCAHVARAAAQTGVRRVVLVSSLAAGGPSLVGRARTEDDPDVPCNSYGRSKLRGEALLKAEAGGTEWTILRPPAVYGPRDVSFLILARLARRGWVPAIGRVPQQVSLIHARDLAEAIVAASESERASGRTYYVAHPEVTDWESLGRLIAARLGRRVSRLRVPRPAIPLLGRVAGVAAALTGRPNALLPDRLADLLAPAWVCSGARAETDFGFRARIDAAAGFAETVDWYRAEGLL